jgi:metallo-beta-lactamase family protein
MQLTFLGAARCVTGSRFLLDTGKARIIVDSGMFQGNPHEVIRNRVPLGVDPATVDALVLTHAHLDHCGMLPVLVKQGFQGPIFATPATADLTDIVLLDSAKLQGEFAERAERRRTKDPARAERYARQDREAYDDAVALAAQTAAADTAEGSDPGVAAETGSAAAVERATFQMTRESGGRVDPEQALLAQPPEAIITLDDPLYLVPDVERTMSQVRTLEYGAEHEIAPGVHATLYDAGHILGSGMVKVRVASDGGRDTVIVFSGDVGRPGTPILRDPTALDEADYVIVESTYGGREHEPQDQSIARLADAVRSVERSHGVLLIPSFAIGRTQEIVWELDRLVVRGEIPQLPLYLDSPMAGKASDVYRKHPDAYDQETADLLRMHETPLDYPGQIVTNDAEDSKRINVTEPPFIVVASNGMLTGGRVLHHFNRIAEDSRSLLLFVGYQGEGTLGAHLLQGERHARVDGRDLEVRCQVKALHGFSAHADDPELRAWLGNFVKGRRPGDAGVPRKVFLVHGDPPAQDALKPKIEAMGLPVHIPTWHETVTLG